MPLPDDAQSDTPARPTIVPERPKTPAEPVPAAPLRRLTTPPDGSPSQRPSIPPRSWPEVVDAAIDKITRRALRGGVAVMIFKLQLAPPRPRRSSRWASARWASRPPCAPPRSARPPPSPR